MAYLFRADHIGELLAPTRLSSAAADMTQAADAAIQATIALQKDTGINVLTDGGLRRTSPCSMFAGAVHGVQTSAGPPAPYVVDRLVRQARLTATEVAYLRRHAGAPFKIFLPSPVAAALQMQGKGRKPACYPELSDVAVALAEIIRQEITDLVADGVPYIQLNCPAYESASGFDSVEQMLAIDAAALADMQRTADISLAVFLPRSATQAAARAQALEAALQRLPADRFLIGFDSQPQAADFAPLRALPAKKIAVLGLVDTLAARANEVDPLLDKIDAAGEFADTASLAISPQRSFVERAGVDYEQLVKAQRTALALAAEAARRYWGIEL